MVLQSSEYDTFHKKVVLYIKKLQKLYQRCITYNQIRTVNKCELPTVSL